jgi:hypothetical protein
VFKTYNIKIKKILANGAGSQDWKKTLETHKLMIMRIQHERLIHLLVTIFVGIVMTASFLVTVTTGKIILAILDIPLLALFAGYIFHYRFLENTTQNWYKMEDQIIEKIIL